MQNMLSLDPHTLLVGLLVAGIFLTIFVSLWIRVRPALPSFPRWIPIPIIVKEKGVSVDRTTTRLVLPTHSGPVHALDWSPDGAYLAATEGKQVHVWRVLLGKRVFTYPGHNSTVRSLRWSPNNSFIASRGDEGTFRMWRFKHRQGAMQDYARRTAGEVACLAWSPLGDECACAVSESIVLFGGKWPHLSEELMGDAHPTPVQCLAWSESARYIASSGCDGEVFLWDAGMQNGRLVARYPVIDSEVTSLTFAARDTLFVAGYADGTMRVWSVPDSTSSRVLDMGILFIREPLRTSREHFGKITVLCCSPSGTWIASGCSDMKVRVWNVETGALLMVYLVGSPVHDLRWSPNGKHLAVGAEFVPLQIVTIPSHRL